jgi:hypothetical protein
MTVAMANVVVVMMLVDMVVAPIFSVTLPLDC